MEMRAAIAAEAAKFFARHGKTATFSPSAAPDIPCKVFINFDVDLQPAGLDAQVWEKGTTIDALLAETLTAPVRGEKFIVDAVEYTVQAILENDGIKISAQVT